MFKSSSTPKTRESSDTTHLRTPNGTTVDDSAVVPPLSHHHHNSHHNAPARSLEAGQGQGQAGLGGLGGHERFSFKGWIRLWWIDLVTLAAMGALGLGVYEAPPAPSRSFPIYFENGQVVYPQFAYPLRKEVVPIWLAALLAFLVPFVFFALFQIRRRSFHDLTQTTIGLLMSLVTAAVFQVFLKCLVGGLRPHFLAVCAPNIQQGAAPSGNGFGNLMYQRTVCTGDKHQINDALESFPSGHSTAAGAGFFYLALYFNAQLKVLADYRPAYWKLPLTFAPVLGACLIAGALTIDEYHNWYDVLAGLTIGLSFALSAFRMTFASVFDFRFNHLLLAPSSARAGLDKRFEYTLHGGAGAVAGKGEVDATGYPFTRANGWGVEGSGIGGAPGDALR